MPESVQERMANTYSVEAFAAGIKAQHPEYKDIEDQVLVEKMIEKYPQYRDMVSLPQPVQSFKKKDSTESVSTGEEASTASDSSYSQVPTQVVQDQAPEEPVDFFTSVKNSAENIYKNLTLFDDKLDLLTTDVFENVFGAEMANSMFKWTSENLWGEDLKTTRAEALKEIEAVQASMGETRGIIESAKALDPVGLTAASIDAVGGFAVSMVEGLFLGGAPLVVDMVGSSIADYNSEKARALGIDTVDLYNTGQAEFAFPTTIGAISYRLEKFGQGKLSKQLADGLMGRTGTKEAAKWTAESKLGKLFLSNPNREGMTEYAQSILDGYSMAEARGESFDAFEYATSEEAFEAYLMGAVGAGIVDLGVSRATGANRRNIDAGKVENAQTKEEIKDEILKAEEAIQDPTVSDEEKQVLRKAQKRAAEKHKQIVEKEQAELSEYSEEDKDALADLDREFTKLKGIYKRSKREETKKALGLQIEEILSKKKAIEEKYGKKDDTQKETGLPSGEQVGETLVKEQPIEEPSAEAVAPSGVVQAPKEKVKAKKEKPVTPVVKEAPVVEEVTAPVEEAPVAEEVKKSKKAAKKKPETPIKTVLSKEQKKEEAKKKADKEQFEAVNEVAPRSKYSGVQPDLLRTKNGYRSSIEKVDKRSGKATRYEIDIFVNPKTKEVTHSITTFVDGKETDRTDYSDVKSFRDAVNKKMKAGATMTEQFKRDIESSVVVEKDSGRIVEFKPPTAKKGEKAPTPPAESIVRKETATYINANGEAVQVETTVYGNRVVDRERGMPYAISKTVVNNGKEKVDRFESKQQFDDFMGRMARRKGVKVISTYDQKLSEQEKAEVKPTAPVLKQSPKIRKRKFKGNRTPYKFWTFKNFQDEKPVFGIVDGEGNLRLYRQVTTKSGEIKFQEVNERVLTGGISVFDIVGDAKFDNKREIISTLRQEAKLAEQEAVAEEQTVQEVKPVEEVKKEEAPVKKTKQQKEVESIESDIAAVEMQIEDLEFEITTEKDNLRIDIEAANKRIENIKKSNADKESKKEQIEEIKYEIQDLKDDNASLIETYKEDLAERKRELKKLQNSLKKKEAQPAKPTASIKEEAVEEKKEYNWREKYESGEYVDIRQVIQKDPIGLDGLTSEAILFDTKEEKKSSGNRELNFALDKVLNSRSVGEYMTPMKRLAWVRKYLDPDFRTDLIDQEVARKMTLSELLGYYLMDNNFSIERENLPRLEEGFKALGKNLNEELKKAIKEEAYKSEYELAEFYLRTTRERSQYVEKNRRGYAKSKVLEAVSKTKKLLASLKISVPVVVHETTSDFNKAMANYSSSGASRRTEGGRFIYNKVTGEREIHINLEAASTTTPMHEAFHAFWAKSFDERPEVAIDLAKKIYSALSKGSAKDRAIAKKLDDFIKKYESEEIQAEEFLAEFAAVLSKAPNTLNKTSLQKVVDIIKKFILDAADKLGIQSNKIDALAFTVAVEQQEREAVDFIRSFVNGSIDMSKVGDEFANIPSQKSAKVDIEGSVREMSEIADGAQMEVGGFLVDYLQTSELIKQKIKDGSITFKRKLKDFDNRVKLLHQPDNASVADIRDKRGNIIIKTSGGVLFPMKFDGSLWASTRDAAEKMASDMNLMHSIEGKITMAITSAPADKIYSSTETSRNVQTLLDYYMKKMKFSNDQVYDYYSKLYNSIFRDGGELGKEWKEYMFIYKEAIKNPKTLEDNKVNGKFLALEAKFAKAKKLGVVNFTSMAEGEPSIKPVEVKSLNQLKKLIFNIKDPDASTFKLRKDITTRSFASFIESMSKEQKKEFTDLTGFQKATGKEIKEQFEKFMNEPVAGNIPNGMAYAVIETESAVEAVEVVGEGAHPSYPYQIVLKDKSKGVKIHFLESAENPHAADNWDLMKDTLFSNRFRSEDYLNTQEESEAAFMRALYEKQAKTFFPTSGISQLHITNPEQSKIDDINSNILKYADGVKENPHSLQTYRVKNKAKYSAKVNLEEGSGWTKEELIKMKAKVERSEIVDESELDDMAQGLNESERKAFKSKADTGKESARKAFLNQAAKVRGRGDLMSFLSGIMAFAESKGLIYSQAQKTVRGFLEAMESQMSTTAYKVRRQASKMRKLADSAETLNDVYAYLTEKDENVRLEMREQLLKSKNGEKLVATADAMRQMVDSYSERFLNDPMFDALPEAEFKDVVEGKDGTYNVINTKTGEVIAAGLTKAKAKEYANAPALKDIIRANLGSYLHTSYRFFTNKSFTISQKAKNKAYKAEYEVAKANKLKDLIEKGMTEEEALAELKKESVINELFDQAVESIDNYVREIEALKKDPEFRFTGISAGAIKIPKTALQRKKGVPEHIATLLGKEKDPVNSFIETMMVMSKTIYKTQMVTKISDALGAGYVKESITKEELNSGDWKKVDDKYSPLNGKYVKTEIFEMLQSKPILQSENELFNAYFKGLKLMRKSKVVWNLPTWRKNLTGGMFFIAANGIINPAFAKDLKNRTERTLKGEANPEIEALLEEMAELGLIGADVQAGLIDLNDAAMNMLFDEDLTRAEATTKKIWSKLKNVDSKLAEKYTAIDDYTKLIIYRVERDSFAKKLYGQDYKSLTEEQQKKVREAAGEFVKQNTPTFSRLPKWYKEKFAKFPLGDFLGFKLEAWRSITSNLKNAVEDIKKAGEEGLNDVQRAEYKKAGYRRLAGSVTTLAARAAIPAILTSLWLDDDDDELVEDALAIRPSWMEGHTLIVKNIDDEGNVSVYNYSMEDPYGEVTDVMMGDFGTFSDFMTPNMFIKLMVHLTEGRDAYGKDLYDAADPMTTKFAKMMGYTTKSVVIPPSVSSSIKYQENQMLIRDYKYNLGQQFYFSAREYTKGTPYHELSGNARSNRLSALDDVRRMYEAVMNVGGAKGNVEMLVNANKVLNRFDKIERAYIQGGIVID